MYIHIHTYIYIYICVCVQYVEARKLEYDHPPTPELTVYGGFQQLGGPILGSPYNKSPTILGYILGP